MVSVSVSRTLSLSMASLPVTVTWRTTGFSSTSKVSTRPAGVVSVSTRTLRKKPRAYTSRTSDATVAGLNGWPGLVATRALIALASMRLLPRTRTSATTSFVGSSAASGISRSFGTRW